MDDLILLDTLEEVARELFRRHGTKGKTVTVTIEPQSAIVRDSHNNIVEEIKL